MRVLISGAGIAGLSLALRLRGLAPIVVERSPRLRDGGYMLDCPIRTSMRRRR